MIDHTQALRDVDNTLAGIGEQLDDLGRRQSRMIRIGIAAIVAGLLSVIAISLLVTSAITAIQAQNAVICPAVGILASTDPPRTTPAGRRQAAEAEKLLRGAAFEACR